MVEPDTVYVKPPKSEVILQDGALCLRDVLDDARVRHPIDEFFISLARENAENAVAVVLSGAGSDGTAGIREINVAGGLDPAGRIRSPSRRLSGPPLRELPPGGEKRRADPQSLSSYRLFSGRSLEYLRCESGQSDSFAFQVSKWEVVYPIMGI